MRTMMLAVAVSLALSGLTAWDQKPPSAPTPAAQRKLALPSQLATDNVRSVTTVGGLRIELTSLEPSFTTPLDYRASLRVTSRTN